MEYLGLLAAVKYGTPVLLLALIIINIYQSTVIKQLQYEIKNLKGSITWGDTCNERHARIDTRLDKVESKVFNGRPT